VVEMQRITFFSILTIPFTWRQLQSVTLDDIKPLLPE
jgi:hypothetical protein